MLALLVKEPDFGYSGPVDGGPAALLFCVRKERLIEMARKKGDRIVIKLKSTESEYIYYSEKNKRNDTARLELKKYDPLLRRHVVFREAR
jgi:large subunit ribosomal protein L33